MVPRITALANKEYKIIAGAAERLVKTLSRNSNSKPLYFRTRAVVREPSAKFQIINPATDIRPKIRATEEQEISVLSTVPVPENAATEKITIKAEITMKKTAKGNKSNILRSPRNKLIELFKLER